MRLDRATHHAGRVRGPKEAARLANDINYELALGEHPPEHEQEGERALAELEDRYPGTRERSMDIEEPPRLSHTAGRRLREHGDSARDRVRQRRGGTAPAPAAAPRRGGSQGRRAVTGARKLAGQGANTISSSTWGQTAGDVIVWAIALSIGYLLITRAAAAGKLFEGATNVVRAIVSPVVDPLNPKGAIR